ncbi:ABC transporter ATP-binding protein [Desulfogranum mediterraneum]|uniref:ABC transporter ATP-binding protein n=1 Tax=Desulfogranum mediterraneum TaxID=160661 RepID=UPI000419EE13|nr:dipeptide ABC transporter ATP-binding protein [Desulfogranum mediterraneum]
MPPLLSLDNFSLCFTAAQAEQEETPVLDRISFTLDQGQTHALVGESGSGKSVTALSILRLLEEISTVRTSGRIVFAGAEIGTLDRERMRRLRGNQIAMIFQEPMSSLNPVYTIGHQLLEPLLTHQQLSREDAYQRALELLDRTGITNPEYRFQSYPHQLSGGQRQRVMIAMALACTPKLLIADEPTTALDITIQEQILDLIQDLQEEYQMAVLLITHDLPMVKKRAETVSIMHQGRIIEQGSCAEIFANPQEPYTIRLLESIPSSTRRPPRSSTPLISLREISCSFTMHSRWSGFFRRTSSKVKAVDKVSLEVPSRQTLGIVGESGSGKSSLAMCLLGLYPYSGEVIYHSPEATVSLSSLSPRRMRPYRRELQVVFQDPYSSLSPRMTIGQIIGEGLQVHAIGRDKKERLAMVEQALLDVELDPGMAFRFPHEFSGGQRQRIAIARALILRPKLLILDEPTSALDATIQQQILKLLTGLQERYGMTYIFISHDLRTVRAIADRIAVFRQGKIVETGPAAEIFARPSHSYSQALFKAAFH